ncbi:centromere protein T isoform X2 [Nannospalax galili]|uniref:centromere protein T isoform X2 n=1 Tax=Nannospalax galili TaxID=1026970 RepID=UPI00111C58B1|nr:centromere protein T isoform X2 [Nannospalax galili]
MADRYRPDSEPTTRTLLQRVLDTADLRTPRRRRSRRTLAQRTFLESPASKRLSSQTKTTTRRRSHGARSVVRLAHVQANGDLEEQTPRTLLKNILLTAPESSIVMPDSVMKPVEVSKVVQSSRQESSQGSLELQLPELEPSLTLAPGLPAPGKRKQRLRLSVFQQEVNQGLTRSQEPPGNADVSSLTSSLSLTFATPLQPQSVKRPGLARRPLTRRAVDIGALLQGLRDNSLASAPPDIVLEDTQPFSQPLVGCSPSVHHSLPHPSHIGIEDTERAVSHRRQSIGPGQQSHISLPCSELQPQPPEVTEAVGSQEVMEARKSKESSEDEDTSGRPAGPELASSTPDLLKTKQPHQFLEPPSLPPGVAVLSSEPLESMPVRLPPRPRTAGPRHHQDPYKAGLSYYAKLFSFYAKMPMEKKALEIVEKCLDKYFQHLCNDLEVFADHAGRKTVKVEDLELLMRRQGLVTDQISLHVLVERHLPLEYRQLLIPCAFTGNSVFPTQ